MQMIIEEEQCKRPNYKYAIPALALNLLLFLTGWDRKNGRNPALGYNGLYSETDKLYGTALYGKYYGEGSFAKCCELSETI